MMEKAMDGNRGSFSGNWADGADVPVLRVLEACQ